MRVAIKSLSIVIIISIFSGCILFDNGTDNVIDDYDVTWIDLHERRALYKGEELVPPYVFAAGHDSKFVFAKQHPLLPDSKEIIDKSVTNYYIIERTTNAYQDKPIFGPFNKEEFIRKCRELKISTPKFDLTFPTNLY